MHPNRFAPLLAAAAALGLVGCVPVHKLGRPPAAQQARLAEVRVATYVEPTRAAYVPAFRTSVDDEEPAVPRESRDAATAALRAAVAEESADLLADTLVREAALPGRRVVRLRRSFSGGVPHLERPDPPDTATFAVRVDSVALYGDAGRDVPLVLRAHYSALEVRGYDGEGPYPNPVRIPLALTDPSPRPLRAWIADDARPLREGLAALRVRAARALAHELTVVGAGVSRGDGCGPGALEPAHGAEVADPAVLAWTRWEPEGGGTTLRVSYDVRAWRLDAAADTPVLSHDGLEATTTPLPPLTPGARYAWTVRGVATGADGRTFSTEWSRPAPANAWCDSVLDPALGHRFSARVPSAPPAVAPTTDEPPRGVGHEATALPPRERRLALRSVSVTTSPSPPQPTYLPGRVRYGAHAGRSAGAAAGASLKACGLLAPLCMVVAIPIAAVGGAATAKDAPPQDVQEDLLRTLAASAARIDVGASVSRGAASAAAGTPLRFVTPGEASDATIEVELVRVSFLGGYGTRPSVVPEVEVGASLRLAGGGTGYRRASAVGLGPFPLAVFREDGARLLDVALAGALETAVSAVLAELIAGPDEVPPRAPPPSEPEP